MPSASSKENMSKHVDLVTMIRCHARPDCTERALKHSVKEIPQKAGVSTHTVIVLNNPTKAVRNVTSSYIKNPAATIIEPPQPPAKPGTTLAGKYLLNAALQKIDDLGIIPLWTWHQDDDEVLAPGFENRLHKLLHDPGDILAYSGVSLFLWGKDEENNALVNMKQFHYSPIILRYRPGFRFSLEEGTDSIPQIQRKIMRNPYRTKTLPFYIIDTGSDTQEKRDFIIGERIQSNGESILKTDKFMAAFGEEPVLVTLQSILHSKGTPWDHVEYQLSLGYR